MSRKFYNAFTLVEMLIVMGILIILMVIGITAGRFAINRANDVAHQNATENIYLGLQAYYTDNREYPDGTATISEMLDEGGALFDYMDQGAFNGGTEASFYYFVEADAQQSTLVCVTLGGIEDERDRGIFCTGNGFGDTELGAVIGVTVTDKEIPYSADPGVYQTILLHAEEIPWDGDAWL